MQQKLAGLFIPKVGPNLRRVMAATREAARSAARAAIDRRRVDSGQRTNASQSSRRRRFHAFSSQLLQRCACFTPAEFRERRLAEKRTDACNPPTNSPTPELHLINSSSSLNSDFCTLGLFFRARKRVHAAVSVKRRRSSQRFCLSDGHKQTASEKLRSCSDAAAASALRA